MSNKELRAPFRRIVTGHDAEGRAVILEDAPPPRVARIGGEHAPLFFEVWNTRETPARIDRASGEPTEDGIQLAPPKNGTRIRGSKHAFMHRTETIDYGIVLEGEITLIMDEGETVVRAGDIVVQRGTNHGWANSGKAPCRIAFILIDGRFDAELAP